MIPSYHLQLNNSSNESMTTYNTLSTHHRGMLKENMIQNKFDLKQLQLILIISFLVFFFFLQFSSFCSMACLYRCLFLNQFFIHINDLFGFINVKKIRSFKGLSGVFSKEILFFFMKSDKNRLSFDL
jgi:hypothetical protein